MRDLIMFDKMFWSRRLFLLSIITIMIYQLIDVTINYRQYPTIIKSDYTYFESGDLPSLTFCPSYYDWDLVSKSVENSKSSSLSYEFAYNIQQKSHTNNSVRQIWNIHLILLPKVLNVDEYFAIMSDVMITNIPSNHSNVSQYCLNCNSIQANSKFLLKFQNRTS